MEYHAPLKDIDFALRELAGLEELLAMPGFADVDADTVEQVLDEAANFARDVLAPLNVPGDRAGCRVADRAVVPPEGFSEAYAQFVENGWPALAASPEYGGMGLPDAVGLAGFEMWNAANMAFSLCPMLTGGAANAIMVHGSDDMKAKYLPKLVSGEWSGTMVLTEPHAGSDLAPINAKAVPDGNHYRIYGTKIFITWGDHPMAENTIHLVIARVAGAAEGIRGISMFLVPKYLVNDDGSIGERNDVFPASVEHKLGIHGSPTCVMSFGDTDGAIGYLVGEEGRGMANMFTMMNQARLEVGVQGLAISERAYQLARSYAQERVQGMIPDHDGRVTIIKHADVRRQLLMMKSRIEAMRGAAYAMGAKIDASHHAGDDDARAAAASRAELMTPIIKGWSTEVAQEITSIGVQIHGGMGFVEETGAAQHMRDARILPIYEGTTGIQAADLVGRKILRDEGREISSMIAEMQQTASEMEGHDGLEALRQAFIESVSSLESAVGWLVSNAISDPDIPGAASVNLLMLAGTVLGGWQMAKSALACSNDGPYDKAFREAKLATAEFYMHYVLPRSAAYASAAMAGPDSLMRIPEDQF